jgi:pimeloyl-ACP methyl ester carboxylesterase
MRRSLLALATAAALLVPAAGAHAAAKPTVVLVHGSFADASGWSAEIAALQSAGYTAYAPANPQRGVVSDAAYIADFLKTVPGPIVLVGHSYGGAVISGAAVGNANVKALVYIDAFVPEQGESVLDLVSKFPGSKLVSATQARPYTGGADIYIKTSAFRDVFAADLPRKVTDVMAAEQRPMSQTALIEKSGPVAWHTIPSFYEVGTKDNAVPPAAQRFMAKRAGSTTVTVKSSHAAMVSHPADVTKLILRAIKKAG